MIYITSEESPYHPGKYTILLNFDNLPPMCTSGSYNVLFARLFDLSYTDYLRMCRDCYGAELIGKNCLYVVPYFKNDDKLRRMVKELNRRIGLVLRNKILENRKGDG